MNLWREYATTGTLVRIVLSSLEVCPSVLATINSHIYHKSRLGQEFRVGLGARHPVDGGPIKREGRKKADVLQLCIRYEKKASIKQEGRRINAKSGVKHSMAP